MRLFEALIKMQTEGYPIAITPSRYSKEAKSRVQSYIDNAGFFVTQDGNKEPTITGIDRNKMTDDWEVFEGPYKKYYDILKDEQQELQDLKNELSPFIEKYNRYVELKHKFGEA